MCQWVILTWLYRIISSCLPNNKYRIAYLWIRMNDNSIYYKIKWQVVLITLRPKIWKLMNPKSKLEQNEKEEEVWVFKRKDRIWNRIKIFSWRNGRFVSKEKCFFYSNLISSLAYFSLLKLCMDGDRWKQPYDSYVPFLGFALRSPYEYVRRTYDSYVRTYNCSWADPTTSKEERNSPLPKAGKRDMT